MKTMNNSMEYNNNLDIIVGDESLDGFEDDNYNYTNNSDVQIGKNSPEASEYDSYSDLTGNYMTLHKVI